MKSEKVISKKSSFLRMRIFWRREWDSNPRDIAVKLISSQSRYDRFDTSAYLVLSHRLAQRLEKCEISMQDNDEKLGTRHPIKPVVMGFPADKVTCRMQTFECSLLRPLEYICLFNFVAGNFPQGTISSFLVYIATDGIYRKKAEVVGR